MAVDMFLKLGDVKGEAKDKTHKEEIDVLAMDFGDDFAEKLTAELDRLAPVEVTEV